MSLAILDATGAPIPSDGVVFSEWANLVPGVASSPMTFYVENNGLSVIAGEAVGLWATWNVETRKFGPPWSKRAAVLQESGAVVPCEPLQMESEGPWRDGIFRRPWAYGPLPFVVEPGRWMTLRLRLVPAERGDLPDFRLALRHS